jgi:hypothetical protein
MHIAIATIVLVIVGLTLLTIAGFVTCWTISDLYRGLGGPYAIGRREAPAFLAVVAVLLVVSLSILWSAYRLWS